MKYQVSLLIFSFNTFSDYFHVLLFNERKKGHRQHYCSIKARMCTCKVLDESHHLLRHLKSLCEGWSGLLFLITVRSVYFKLHTLNSANNMCMCTHTHTHIREQESLTELQQRWPCKCCGHSTK
jgi:hypothetical protein